MSVYIIGEAGVNHNGKMELAYQLVDMAKMAGCNCIKFQTYKTEKLVTKTAQKAEYQKNNDDSESQFDMLKKLELSYDQFYSLKKYCDKQNIDFLSTAFDEESVDFLYDLGMRFFKVSSGDITNKPLLEYIAKKNKPIIISTGMCDFQDIEQAVSWIENEGNNQIHILHCTSNYPTDYKDVNMLAMETLEKCFGYPIGYSDHTEGITVPILAAARGAQIVEKHFTLDKNMEGPDHKASLTPEELKAMVSAIRIVERAMGDGRKRVVLSEKNTREVARKSMVWMADYKDNTVITNDMIVMKRPGTGIEPCHMDKIVGKKLKNGVTKDSMVKWGDIIF